MCAHRSQRLLLCQLSGTPSRCQPAARPEFALGFAAPEHRSLAAMPWPAQRCPPAGLGSPGKRSGSCRPCSIASNVMLRGWRIEHRFAVAHRRLPQWCSRPYWPKIRSGAALGVSQLPALAGRHTDSGLPPPTGADAAVAIWSAPGAPAVRWNRPKRGRPRSLVTSSASSS